MTDWVDVAYLIMVPLGFLAAGLFVLYINRREMRPQDHK